ncbi:MAG: hypothetical protein E7246_04915 [Lachnoclostridium sp.]|nr:hypothetical protein [Lachnoclostridium sp.]
MDWRKFAKSFLYPHIAVMIILIPIAAILLVVSMVYIGTDTITAYVSYVLAAYTLTICCFRLPALIRFFKAVRTENKYVQLWYGDLRLRSNIMLYGSSIWNTVYAVFQLWLGFYHHTFWYYSLGGYYVCLAIMRFYLVRYLRKNKPGEKMEEELKRYRFCGWIFLAMNTALALIIFFMVYWNRTFEHNMITAITMAAYTFTTFTMAIINLIKYRKYNSPILSASKNVSMAAACVSMLTLESTMLTTFNDGSMSLASRRILLGTTGAAVSLFVITMAVAMIVRSTKRIKITKIQEENSDGEQR